MESLAQDLTRISPAVTRVCAALSGQVGEQAFSDIAGEDADLVTPAALESAAQCAREALGGTQRIRDISRSLGTFSRVERVELVEVDVAAVIRATIKLAANELRYWARVVTDFGDVPPIRASTGKLSQVFLNLLINAAHAIDEGSVERNQVTFRTWADGRRVLVEVSDTGCGIAPENLERIFEPFFTTKGIGKGSGLGLSICRRILHDFGGDITVKSELGRGTTFCVRLPATSGIPKAARSEPMPPPPAPHATVRGRVLVVDDEPAIRVALQRLLRSEHDVVLADSGLSAKALLDVDRAFDVVLCDAMMPAMSGMELHQWLLGCDPGLAGRFVFITGGAFTPRSADYLSTMRSPPLEKPFDSDDVKQRVAAVVLMSRNPTRG